MSRPDAVRAAVQVDGVVTRYLCAGHGRRVVLLVPADLDDAADAPLFGRLADCCKVICAAVPDDASVDGWLRGLIDGLGLDQPVIVVPSDALSPWAAHLLGGSPGEKGGWPGVIVVGAQLDGQGCEEALALAVEERIRSVEPGYGRERVR